MNKVIEGNSEGRMSNEEYINKILKILSRLEKDKLHFYYTFIKRVEGEG